MKVPAADSVTDAPMAIRLDVSLRPVGMFYRNRARFMSLLSFSGSSISEIRGKMSRMSTGKRGSTRNGGGFKSEARLEPITPSGHTEGIQ